MVLTINIHSTMILQRASWSQFVLYFININVQICILLCICSISGPQNKLYHQAKAHKEKINWTCSGLIDPFLTSA